MLYYSKQAIEKTKRDFKIISILFNYVLNFAMAIFYIVSLCMQKGNAYANAILLAVTSVVIVLNVVCDRKELTKKERKQVRKKLRTFKNTVSWVKILTKAYTLGATLYAMYITTTQVNPISIIMTTLLVILWVLSLVIEIVKMFFIMEYERLLRGLAKDFEWATKTKDAIGNTVENVKEGVIDTTLKIKNFFTPKKKKEINEISDIDDV